MFAAAIVPQKVVEEVGDKEFAENPVGSGPFMVTEFKRGQRTVLEAQPALLARGPAVSRRGRLRVRPRRQHADAPAALGRGRRRRRDPLQPGRLARGHRRSQRRGRRLAQVGRDLPQHQRGAARRGRGPPGARLRDAHGPDPRRGPVRQRAGRPTARSRGSSTGTSRSSPTRTTSPRPRSCSPSRASRTASTSSCRSPRATRSRSRRPRSSRQQWAKIGVNVSIVPRDFGTMFWRLARGQGRRGGDLPRRRALERHALRRRDRGAHVRPGGRPQLARDVLRQPEGHRPARRREGNAGRGPAGSGLRRDPADRPGRRARACRCSSPSRSPATRTRCRTSRPIPIGWWPLREVWLSE